MGKLTIIEEPDIDTQGYIYSFERLNGTSQEELDRISIEIMEHMEKFSIANGIENFDRAVCILI